MAAVAMAALGPVAAAGSKASNASYHFLTAALLTLP